MDRVRTGAVAEGRELIADVLDLLPEASCCLELRDQLVQRGAVHGLLGFGGLGFQPFQDVQGLWLCLCRPLLGAESRDHLGACFLQVHFD